MVQDPTHDRNIICGLLATACDLIAQLSRESVIKKLCFGTTTLKLAKKFLVDPWTLDESSLSNNLLMTVCYSDKETGVVQACSDKGANSLRFAPEGATTQSCL